MFCQSKFHFTQGWLRKWGWLETANERGQCLRRNFILFDIFSMNQLFDIFSKNQLFDIFSKNQQDAIPDKRPIRNATANVVVKDAAWEDNSWWSISLLLSRWIIVAINDTILGNGISWWYLLWRQLMRSTECKGEYLAVEAALNATGEEAEEESADQKDLWMLYQLLGFCFGRSIL